MGVEVIRATSTFCLSWKSLFLDFLWSWNLDVLVMPLNQAAEQVSSPEGRSGLFSEHSEKGKAVQSCEPLHCGIYLIEEQRFLP